MQSDPLVVLPLERYPAAWILTATTALNGTVSVGFTVGHEPDNTTVWYTASWSDTDPTAMQRVAQTMVAGSAAAQVGDAYPGAVGDYTAWIRYVDLSNAVRIRPGGQIRFR